MPRRPARRAGFSGLDALLEPEGRAIPSLAEAARAGGPNAEQAAAGLSRLSLGEDPERVSRGRLRPPLVRHRPVGRRLRRPRGAPFRAICRSASAARCSAIDWSGRERPGRDGRAAPSTAAAVIVTVPVGVLKSGAIRFTPGPARRRAGCARRAAAWAPTPRSACGSTRPRSIRRRSATRSRCATGGPTIYFEMGPFGRPLAVANLGGDLARDLCRAGEAAAVGAGHRTPRCDPGRAGAGRGAGRAARRLVDGSACPRHLLDRRARPCRRPDRLRRAGRRAACSSPAKPWPAAEP